MTPQETHSNIQAVRRVDENGHPSTLSNLIHLVCHSDPSSGKDIILWEDILAAFKTNDVIHVRSGTIVLPFLKDSDFKNLDPLRIAAVPGVTLDIVVGGQLGEKKPSMASLQEALPDAAQENNFASSVSNSNNAITTTGAAAVRRNPAGGVFEAAMDAYRDNEYSAFGPKLRGPQEILDSPSLSPTSDTTPISQTSFSSSQTPAPQEFAFFSNKSFAETMEHARLGNKVAQFVIGESYSNAKEVPKDFKAAMEWYLKATDQGYAEAQNAMGFIYNHGRGVPQDYGAAMAWYRKAANQGLSIAQYNIGTLYEQGFGTPQNYQQAMEWYLEAAHQGHAASYNNIGSLYHFARGVPQDYSLAMNWYRRADEQGSKVAAFNLGFMYENGQGVEKDMARALEWYRKASKQGNVKSKDKLAQLKSQGYDVQTGKKLGLFGRLFN
ncbi:hypothetical protein BGW39_003615 [Mortierella sp. 14UC]|nr:hypothetical protein BGW39_003615 [Mortierella sp. 14UC]